MTSKYVIAFWYKSVGSPDLIAETVREDAGWNMDEAFKYMMCKFRVSFVVYATFTLYNQDFPEGISAHRWDLILDHGVYSYTEEVRL